MENQNDGSERRQFKRVAISSNDSIIGIISSSRLKAEDSIAVNIIDLSAGGLHFFLPKTSFKEIRSGDHLTLREIRGAENLDFISDVELEVKWVAEHQSLKNIGLGCEFLNISDEIRQQIDQFVDTM